MKFILIGGTGNIGRAIIKVILDKGYSFSNISRNPSKSKKVLPEGQLHLDFSSNNQDELKQAFYDADAVINLAGTSIAAHKWTSDFKKEVYDSRILTTKKVVEILNLLPENGKVLISTSATGIYGNRGDEILNESSELGNDFLANLCKDWEITSRNIPNGIRVVNPRVGVVLDKFEGALPKMVTPFKFFIGGPLGKGNQWMPWIHIKDLANLFVYLAENKSIIGPINAVSPSPVQMKDFAKILGKSMKRPALFPVPEFALKILLGESASMVTNSQRVDAGLLLKNNFKFNFPELELALGNLLK